ncbi:MULTISPECIES: GNAT family N-acetyltransferase [unclassified Paludibacterium]|uniref:GNAT family N-acetyltransferase n=1 Tax=unclassified Paludibacterium TaxID=2618429 RepID=UPI001C05951B|nr:GNAT family N-acetyltransferase [Paludibacterium sp. B53371]BEV71114.1 GNAT family N-acetyltransferase [Paludibacterium sp. THUN1379]
MSLHWHTLAYADTDPQQRQRIHQLLDLVWPAEPAIPSVEQPAHDLSLAPRCILGCQDENYIAYAAILSKPVHDQQHRWLASGLSCVCVHPAHRQSGIGQQLLQQAWQSLRRSSADFCVFTCDPPLKRFYEQAGWQAMPGLILRGGRQTGALDSLSSGKTVLLRPISDKAHQSMARFASGELDLDLPLGQFW